MAYEKQTWNTGDIITKEKLNHMEDGIKNAGSEVFIVNLNMETQSLDKTWNEINTAIVNKQPPYMTVNYGSGKMMFPITGCYDSNGKYIVMAFAAIDSPSPSVALFTTTDPDDYPSEGSGDSGDQLTPE